MSPSSDLDIRIQPVPPERWASALELVLSRRPAAERASLMQWILLGGSKTRLAGLIGAFSGDQIVGAALAMVMAGRTALVYQPRINPATAPQVASQLWAAIEDFLDQHQVRLAQEVLPLQALADAEQTRLAGFSLSTELVYYHRETHASQENADSDHLALAPCEPNDQTRLARVIELTYQGTQDCPELNGVRSTVDVIEGYLEGRPWDSRCWQFIRVDGQDIGCVLLTMHGEASCELVYLGLIATARGRGLGRLATQRAIGLGRSLGCSEITVATDVRNTPARRAYEQSGFIEFDRRRVLLKVLGNQSP